MPSVTLNCLDRTLKIQNFFLFLPFFPNHLFLISSHQTKLVFSQLIIGTQNLRSQSLKALFSKRLTLLKSAWKKLHTVETLILLEFDQTRVIGSQNILVRNAGDVVLLEKAKGSFEYITSPINRAGKSVFPLEKMITAQLKAHYHHYNYPLRIVAITDGASNIRRRLNQLNPQGITIILDWYHLCKKVREFLSMIARNKAEKTDHSKFLFFHLWRGKIEEVLTYLTTKIKARNPEKLNELITYFTKHKSEIINYARRSQAGKTIGSGRMEKGVDERYWSSSKT